MSPDQWRLLVRPDALQRRYVAARPYNPPDGKPGRTRRAHGDREAMIDAASPT